MLPCKFLDRFAWFPAARDEQLTIGRLFMPRVSCRCGEKLQVPADGPERIECPKCGAKIRLRRPTPEEIEAAGDGFVRFHCPCGRRLKVPIKGRPAAGKCPDCGRVVPVPENAWHPSTPGRKSVPGDPEARTEEMDANDLAALEEWAAPHLANSRRTDKPGEKTTSLLTTLPGPDPVADTALISKAGPPNSAVKFEAGMRICPRCKKPIHLGASTCRACGTPVPRQ